MIHSLDEICMKRKQYQLPLIHVGRDEASSFSTYVLNDVI